MRGVLEHMNFKKLMTKLHKHKSNQSQGDTNIGLLLLKNIQGHH